MSHHCHAHECNIDVPPKMFMCKKHWFSLPGDLRDRIWNEYRSGQEIDKSPSRRYLAVSFFCIAKLAFKPNDEKAAMVSAHYLSLSIEEREACIEGGLGDPLEGLVP